MKTENAIRIEISVLQGEINSMMNRVSPALQNADLETAKAFIINTTSIIEQNERRIEALLWVADM